jgi:membrane fusion protein (multidrug efflux system)
LALAACGGEPPSAGPIRERSFVVETAPTELSDIRVTVDAVGTVQASEEAEIRPQVDGILAEIFFDEGARVARGDMLLRLDDAKAAARVSVAQAALDSAGARLKLLENRLARHRRLFSDHLISDEEFESIEAEHSEAAASMREEAAALTLAQRELDDYYIRAPFSGRMGERLVDVGNYVSQGMLLAVLMRTDPIQVVLKIPDRYADRVGPGTPVTIVASSNDDAVRGEIDFVDPRVDPSTRMLSLRASVPNPKQRLLHGQFAQVTVQIEERERQVVIPEEAVLSAAGNTWVYVVHDGVAERRDVTLGERRPPVVEVLDGVGADETIVVGGQHRLRDGAHVTDAKPLAGGGS